MSDGQDKKTTRREFIDRAATAGLGVMASQFVGCRTFARELEGLCIAYAHDKEQSVSRLFKKSKKSKADDPRLQGTERGKDFEACQTGGGTWPAVCGPVANNSRTVEPLVSAPWEIAWEARLETAKEPEGLLLGLGHVVAKGRYQGEMTYTIGIWDGKGKRVGEIEFGYGVCALDVDAECLIGVHAGGLHKHYYSLWTFLVRNAQKDATIPGVGPRRSVISQILKGPNVTLFVKESGWVPFPDQDTYDIKVRSLAIFDFSERDSLGFLNQVAEIGRMARSFDSCHPQVAATDAGPVFATGGGVLWTDWYLNARYEHLEDMVPLAMSVDENGTAYVVRSRGACSGKDWNGREEDEDEDEARDEHDEEEKRAKPGKSGENDRCFLAIIPPGGPVAHEVELPWGSGVRTPPPILSSACDIYLTPPGEVLALDPQGRTRWRRRRSNKSPGIVTGNGLLLVALDNDLVAMDREGERHFLWRLPAPTYTAPVLGNGRIHVATADTLYVLKPV